MTRVYVLDLIYKKGNEVKILEGGPTFKSGFSPYDAVNNVSMMNKIVGKFRSSYAPVSNIVFVAPDEYIVDAKNKHQKIFNHYYSYTDLKHKFLPNNPVLAVLGLPYPGILPCADSRRNIKFIGSDDVGQYAMGNKAVLGYLLREKDYIPKTWIISFHENEADSCTDLMRQLETTETNHFVFKINHSDYGISVLMVPREKLSETFAKLRNKHLSKDDLAKIMFQDDTKTYENLNQEYKEKVDQYLKAHQSAFGELNQPVIIQQYVQPEFFELKGKKHAGITRAVVSLSDSGEFEILGAWNRTCKMPWDGVSEGLTPQFVVRQTEDLECTRVLTAKECEELSFCLQPVVCDMDSVLRTIRFEEFITYKSISSLKNPILKAIYLRRFLEEQMVQPKIRELKTRDSIRNFPKIWEALTVENRDYAEALRCACAVQPHQVDAVLPIVAFILEVVDCYYGKDFVREKNTNNQSALDYARDKPKLETLLEEFLTKQDAKKANNSVFSRCSIS